MDPMSTEAKEAHFFSTETEFDPQNQSSSLSLVPGKMMNSVAVELNSVAGEINLIPV